MPQPVTNDQQQQELFAQRRRGSGLSVRLVLATLIYSFIVSLIIIAIQFYFMYQQAVNNAFESYKTIESGPLQGLSQSLWEVDQTHINIILDSIIQLPEVSLARLTDETGKSWEQKQSFKNLLSAKDFPLTYREGNQTFNLGTLHVELSADDIFTQIKERSLGRILFISITLGLSSLFILMLFQRWVTRHLEKMAEFTQRMNLNELNTQLVLDRNTNKIADELDLVVSSINHLQASLKHDLELRAAVEKELRLHKQNLEILVAERTRELEEKSTLLTLQTQELEAQNTELNAFAHSVAHDLKNPLTTLIAMSKLLADGALPITPEQIKSSTASIHRTALKMNAIVDALLLLASIRRAEEVKVTTIDLHKLADEACGRLTNLAQQYQATISFQGNWQPALGYEQWVEEVWVNYISNAIKYGGIAPKIEIGCQPQANNYIKCWVRDHGAGISADKQADLFIQFSRLDTHITEGHGLGLSIIKRIIQRLKGDVGYEDAEGGGACFWFTLPMLDSNPTTKNDDTHK